MCVFSSSVLFVCPLILTEVMRANAYHIYYVIFFVCVVGSLLNYYYYRFHHTNNNKKTLLKLIQHIGHKRKRYIMRRWRHGAHSSGTGSGRCCRCRTGVFVTGFCPAFLCTRFVDGAAVGNIAGG